MLPPNARLAVADGGWRGKGIFSGRSRGAAFWYENSTGLAEIAVNQGRADRFFREAPLAARSNCANATGSFVSTPA